MNLSVRDRPGQTEPYWQATPRRARDGLGSYPDTSLAEAREKALAARKARERGEDPIDLRRKEKADRLAEKAKALTFDQCKTAYIGAHRAGWKNPKHAQQWSSTLDTYASPIIGELPVQTANTALVMQILQQEVSDVLDADGKPAQLWVAKPETANRLRGRIERILSWAKVNGYRTGENPAVWRGHLDRLLPEKSKVRRVKHHAALPYAEMSTFVAALQAREAILHRRLSSRSSPLPGPAL